MTELIEKLKKERSLSLEEYRFLIDNRTEETARMLAVEAVAAKEKVYGNAVFIRGLIEISNYCKNDCFYCGIRKSNKRCQRYRLTQADILDCCEQGYSLGFRTFVLQGGEDPFFTDETICATVEEIKTLYPDCAVTLSLGERNHDSYKRLYQAGADRYLLRHETADEAHYSSLHPKEMSYHNRINCLENLKEIGFQTGCGFMVGSPFQTSAHIAKDLKFIENFKHDMCGIGPFVPHRDTPFGKKSCGTVELTCFLLSVVRLIQPNILLPATTALGTIDPNGREKGILSGANVVMPNLSPTDARKKYELYDGKVSDGAENARNVLLLRQKMKAIGCEIVTDRGDVKTL